MGLNFRGMVLSQLNLIRAKKKDTFITKLTPKFVLKSNLPWEMGDPKAG
jgi:hypothetical protein